jgi:hypothetical protein
VIALTETKRMDADTPGAELDASLVRAELWRSLVSMLRVYAHAASFNHGEHIVTETTPASVSLEHKNAALHLIFDPGSGNATWMLEQHGGAATARVFRLLEVGLIEFDGEEKELDRAAIDWVEELTRAAAMR